MPNLDFFSEQELSVLRKGGTVRVDRTRYSACRDCGKIIDVSRWFLPGWHLCTNEEEV